MLKASVKSSAWFLISFLFINSFSSCKKESQSAPKPYVKNITVRDVDSLGALFSAQLVGLDRAQIKKVGFIWSSEADPKSTSDRFLVETEKPDLDGIITLRAETGIDRDVTYNLCAFVELNTETHYGDVISFVGKGSKGVDRLFFNRNQGTWGDTITVRAKNLTSAAGQLAVHMNDTKAEVIFANKEEIHFIIPDEVNVPNPIIKLSVNGSEMSYEWFFLNQPLIDSVSQKYFKAGETVTVYGKNFSPIIANNKLTFNNQSVEVTAATNKQVQFKVPQAPLSVGAKLAVQTIGDPITSSFDVFQLVHYRKLSDFPGPASLGFFAEALNNKGYLGLSYLDNDNYYYYHHEIWELNLSNEQWTKKIASSANSSPLSSASFVLNNKLCAPTSGSYPYWLSFDPLTGNVNGKFLPNDTRSVIDAFVIDNIAYCVISLMADQNQVIKLLKLVDSEWVDIGNVNDINTDGVGFVLNGMYYNATGYKDYLNPNVSRYDPRTNQWKKMSDFPGTLRRGAVGFVVNGKGYVYGGNDNSSPVKDVWEYSPDTDSWNLKEHIVSEAHSRFVAFEMEGKAYIIGGDKNYSVNYYGTASREVWVFEP